jgi:hypothetical protein
MAVEEVEARTGASFVRMGITTTGAFATTGRFSQGTGWERKHTGHR